MRTATVDMTDDNQASIKSVQPTCQQELFDALAIADSTRPEERLPFARQMVFTAIASYWGSLQRNYDSKWELSDLPLGIVIGEISPEAQELGRRIGCAAAKLHEKEASYMIGLLYTGMVPGRFRAKFGAYYTPPALCERLLDMATDAGIDWRTAHVLDPACGGGAFLSPIARRMADKLKDFSAKIALKSIVTRLRGFEVDSFAAWMSQVFLEVTLNDLCRAADERLPWMIRICNSLERTCKDGQYDLVIGNPPYGRIQLSPELRQKFRRSLFGHANLYGIFTDLALRLTRKEGVIAYVTPTSFLAGEYFKALRGLLGREAPPMRMDFVEARRGVFTDVLQETLLSAYRRGGGLAAADVYFIAPQLDGSVDAERAGSFSLPEMPEEPWLIPRTNRQARLMNKIGEKSYKLSDYGYTVSTGPLVWNRHKTSLKDRPGFGRYPLIWAESVSGDGVFQFRARKRNHKPYFEPREKENWVVTDIPCVLLQRTTSKEQSRRLIAAELPLSFIKAHGAVVVENHVNMIKPINSTPKVSVAALTMLLNTDVVDQMFRCISGSVAVSAYEMKALPLPPPDAIKEIEQLLMQPAKKETLERAVEALYGMEGLG